MIITNFNMNDLTTCMTIIWSMTFGMFLGLMLADKVINKCIRDSI